MAASSRATGEQFAQVAELGPHGAEAARKLGEVHTELVHLGAKKDADRLMAADEAAGRGDLAMLERMVASGQSLDDLADIRHIKVRRIVGWRNAAALAPLLITWLLLGWASYRYHEQLVKHPELNTQPFLVLWQSRFDGNFIPTFAETAITAFALLALVLVLTIRGHQEETRATRTVARVAASTDDAMNALALAVSTSMIRPPMSAAEWAERAQQVMAETQKVITKALAETTALAEKNSEIATTAQDALVDLQDKGREFIAGLARETRQTMVAIRDEHSQLLTQTATEAKNVLEQTGAAVKQLIEQQMAPLFAGFQSSLEAYRADHELYRTSAATMAKNVTDMTGAAMEMAEGAKGANAIIASMDTNMVQFVDLNKQNAASLTTTGTAMGEMVRLLGGRLVGDLEAMTRNIVDASARLESVQHGLTAASAALDGSTRALHEATRRFTASGPTRGPGFFRRLFEG